MMQRSKETIASNYLRLGLSCGKSDLFLRKSALGKQKGMRKFLQGFGSNDCKVRVTTLGSGF